MGFPTKNEHFGVFWRYHHLRKHPYLHGVFPHHQPSQPSTPINGFHDASSPSSGSWSNRQYSLVPWQPQKMDKQQWVWYVCDCVWKGKTHKHPTKTWEPGNIFVGMLENWMIFGVSLSWNHDEKNNESNQFSSFHLHANCIQINIPFRP